MTREEAISQIKWYFEEDDGMSAEGITKEAVSMAIEALEKQIPKKPNTTVTDEYDENKFIRVKIIECKCPRCDQKFFFSAPLSFDMYCRHCGQALDWNELFRLHIIRADGNLVKQNY